MTRMLLDQLSVVGLLCVEFFVTRDGRLLVNELAPRPHNSGHLTIEGHVTSQFEQHVRAICGLPLGSVEQLRPAAMSNLLGDLWAGGEPNWNAVSGFQRRSCICTASRTPRKVAKWATLQPQQRRPAPRPRRSPGPALD